MYSKLVLNRKNMNLTNPDNIKSLTKRWHGPRDSNGRPLVGNNILQRMESVTTEEAWGVLRTHGYNHSFASDWKILHPQKVLVGRAVTCRFVPTRVDLNESIDRAISSLISRRCLSIRVSINILL